MSYHTKNWEDFVPLIRRLPVDQHYQVALDGQRLELVVHNQTDTHAAMAAFPGIFWHKSVNEYANWWEYRGAYQGIEIKLFGCTEAPPTCRAIEEEYEVEVDVPTATERRTVTRKRTRWECAEDGAVKTTKEDSL